VVVLFDMVQMKIGKDERLGRTARTMLVSAKASSHCMADAHQDPSVLRPNTCGAKYSRLTG
jgi:hypothetical protein